MVQLSQIVALDASAFILMLMLKLHINRQAKISLTMKTDEWKKMLGRIEMEGTDDGTKE